MKHTRDLAEAYGAKLLLDKMKLFSDLVPAILDCDTKADDLTKPDVTSDMSKAN